MVSLDKYKCFCKDLEGLELFTSQKDIQYIKCKESKCGFFTQASAFAQYLRTIEEKVNEKLKVQIPMCNHRVSAALYVSKSEKNPGRPFFKCKERADESCEYFQWGNTPPTKKTLENWKPPTADKATMTDPCPQPKTKKRKVVIKDED